MSYDQMLAKIANLMSSGTKTNAFAPLVWLASIVVLFSMVGMFYFKEPPIRYTFLALIIIVVIFACYMYLTLFLKDPRLLQSESYRIEDKKLDIIASKGSDIQLNPVDLTVPTQKIEEEKHE